MTAFNWKSSLRFVFAKLVGVILAVVFLFVAILFLAYPLIALATNQGGRDAKVSSVTNHMGKFKTGCRIGGLFQVVADQPQKKKGEANSKSPEDKIYCLYPAWPDQLEPQSGDTIRVWPSKRPLVGSAPADGWSWFILGSVFIVGLVLLEFAFLALTLA